MTALRIVLLCLCLLAVAAQVTANMLLTRMARQGKSGIEIIAVALAPVTLVVYFVATPGGAWLAFGLGADAGSAATRFGFDAVGSALAAYLAVVLWASALRTARQRRNRRGYARVMGREEVLGLIESQVIAAVHRSAEGSVTVVYVDNRWVDGVYDYRRAEYADPAGWPAYEAAASRTPGAKAYPTYVRYRPDNAHGNAWNNF